jgi:tether containing UBX domain for GLUT4
VTTLTRSFLYNRHNRKQLDLSLSYRLSGLSSGAKLELVQISRSPSVVTVGLQLPESEARGAPNGRILDKFPSTTTLWMVLRKFEAGVAGTGPARNLTSRAVPSADGGDVAGRLYYEIPVLQILEREVSSFTDLQKTLAQLGFNSGNVLIRLSFRRTEEPIEEAMAKIGEFFKSSEDEAPSVQDKNTAPSAAPAAAPIDSCSRARRLIAASALQHRRRI